MKEGTCGVEGMTVALFQRVHVVVCSHAQPGIGFRFLMSATFMVSKITFLIPLHNPSVRAVSNSIFRAYSGT